MRKILSRLFRVFVHVYIHHFDRIAHMGSEAHVNTCYKHFYYFVKEFGLIDTKELEPLVSGRPGPSGLRPPGGRGWAGCFPSGAWDLPAGLVRCSLLPGPVGMRAHVAQVLVVGGATTPTGSGRSQGHGGRDPPGGHGARTAAPDPHLYHPPPLLGGPHPPTST